MIQSVTFNVAPQNPNIVIINLDESEIKKAVSDLIDRAVIFFGNGFSHVQAMMYHKLNYSANELVVTAYLAIDPAKYKLQSTDIDVKFTNHGTLETRSGAHLSLTHYIDDLTTNIPILSTGSGWFDLDSYQPSLDQVLTRAASVACSHDWRHNKQDEEGVYDWCARCGEKNYTQRRKTWL